MHLINGSVELRPARVGLVAESWTLERLIRGVELATTAWAGMHFPMLSSRSDALTRSLEVASIDVIHPVDDKGGFSDATGFTWRGAGEYGPFGEPQSDYATRLLGHHLLERQGAAAGAPHVIWDPNDALADLFSVWFGRFPDGEYASKQRAALASGRDVVRVAPGQLPPLEGPSGPIGWTTTCLDYKGFHGGPCIVALEPGDVDALRRFWNIRAGGAPVFPWVPSSASRLTSALGHWLDRQRAQGHLHEFKSGDGTRSGRLVGVVQGESCSDDDRLHLARYLSESQSLEAWEHSDDDGRGGWHGSHPFETGAERSFSVETSGAMISISLPALPWLERRRRRAWPGIVAAQVTLHGASGDDARQDSIAVPAIRQLASLLTRGDGPFARPTGDGVALGVQAEDEMLQVQRVPFQGFFSCLFKSPGWTVGQSNEGRVGTQLIRLLGGYDSMQANQPAVRAVLEAAARDSRAKPLPVLLEEARKRRGAWPGRLTGDDERHYSRQVVYRLLHHRLLRPALPVTCPRCSTVEDLRPEDVQTELTCGLCGEHFALGLALALTGKAAGWNYRLAPHIAPAQLRAALPIMATLSVLHTLPRTGRTVSPVVGLTVRDGDWACEVDVAALVADGPNTVMVAGEVKSWRDEITEQDIANLERVATVAKSVGVDALVLAATLRDTFSPGERQALRRLIERSGRRGLSNRSATEPALPIVLTGPDLSLPWMSEDAPWRWGTRFSDHLLANLAEASCRRNLGLGEIKYPRPGDFSFDWTD